MDIKQFIADLTAGYRKLTEQTPRSSRASPGAVADVDAAYAAHEAGRKAGYEAGHAEGYKAGREVGHQAGYDRVSEAGRAALRAKHPGAILLSAKSPEDVEHHQVKKFLHRGEDGPTRFQSTAAVMMMSLRLEASSFNSRRCHGAAVSAHGSASD